MRSYVKGISEDGDQKKETVISGYEVNPRTVQIEKEIN